MKSDDIDMFDELVRGKLSNYSETPEPEWIHSIQVKKGRAVNLYQLYRLMLIAVIVGAGIFAGIQLLPYQSVQNATNEGKSNSSKSKTDNTSVSVPQRTVEFASTVVDMNKISNANASTNSSQYSTSNKDKTVTTTSGNTSAKTNSGAKSSKKAAKIGVELHDKIVKDEKHHTKSAIKNGENSTQTSSEINTDKLEKDAAENANDNIEKEPEVSAIPCKAYFDYYTSYTGELNFTNGSEMISNASIAWDFGDGNTGSNKNAIHSYKTSGEYDVTLTITDDKNSCSISKHIVYQNPNEKTGPITISGKLVAGTAVVKNGTIELYVFDEDGGTYKSLQTVKTNQYGEYSLTIDRKVKYLIKGYPTSDIQDYVATFWGRVTESENAAEIMVMPSEKVHLLGYEINLLVQEHEQANLPEPAQNTPNLPSFDTRPVYLIDKNNNIVSIGTVDEKGNYSFSGTIAGGAYNIVNPETGVSMNKEIAAATNNIEGAFLAEKGNLGNRVTVFPNPAVESLNFEVNSAEQEMATMVILDASGIEKAREQITFNPGLNQSQYNISNFAPGVYYIIIYRNGQPVLSNRVVKGNDNSK